MPVEWEAPQGMFKDRQDVPGVFRTIYDRGVWGGGSGPGSSPQNTQPYMAYLQAFLDSHPIRSVVDIGCGDWQFSQFIDWGTRSYLGIDVVASVISANQKRFGGARRSFSCVNLLEKGAPRVSGDLLIIKDVLQHLSNTNAARLLALTERFRFSLVTNDYAPENADCNNGDTRPLDIRAAPFNLSSAAPVVEFLGKMTFLVTAPGGTEQA